MEVLLGSERKFETISELFSTREDVGLVYSICLDRILGLNVLEDTELLTGEMARLGIRPGARHYCAGTMFAIRASALEWLKDGRISEDIFQTTNTSHATGTMAHAYERLLCLAVTEQGYSTVLVRNSLGRYVFIKVKKWTQPALEWLLSVRYCGEVHRKYLTVCGFRFKLKTAPPSCTPQ